MGNSRYKTKSMKGFLIVALVICFYQSISQDSPLPITVSIKIERTYETKEKKERYARTIRENQYVVNSDYVRQTFYDINLEIKNTSSDSISIWLMKCSYWYNFLINNNYMTFEEPGCDGNYPIRVKFAPGENKEYKFTLARSIKFDYPCRYCVYGDQVETTKLGLIIIDDPFESKMHVLDYDLLMEDKSKWRIVWSNPLYLLGKPEEKK